MAEANITMDEASPWLLITSGHGGGQVVAIFCVPNTFCILLSFVFYVPIFTIPPVKCPKNHSFVLKVSKPHLEMY